MFKRHIAYICVFVFVSIILLSVTATALYQYPLNQNPNEYTQNFAAAASNYEYSLFKRKGGGGKIGGRRSSGSGEDRGCNSTSVGTVFKVKCRHVVGTAALVCVFIYYF